MGIWQTLKAAFALGTAVPPDARRLNAVDVFALSASLEALLVEERGWITLPEARALLQEACPADTIPGCVVPLPAD
jgi:hypothetical protein